MEDEGGSSPIPDLNTFRILIASGSKRKLSQTQQTLVKKLENIPSVALPVETCQTAINITDLGLIGQFTGLWPSPKTIVGWVHRNWKPLISQAICSNVGLSGQTRVSFNVPTKLLAHWPIQRQTAERPEVSPEVILDGLAEDSSVLN